MGLVKGGAASKALGVSLRVLRLWAKKGSITFVRTPGGTRLYDVDAFIRDREAKVVAVDPSVPAMDAVAGLGKSTMDRPVAPDTTALAEPRAAIAYCRVSSAGQKADLARQVAFLKEKCEEGTEVVTDVGSGLNFKRKGLRALLERAMQGTVRSVTVAHRDRLCRFGFELIKWLLERHQVKLVVLQDKQQSPECEFTEDLLAIVHVFSCRFNGLRRYRQAAEEAVEGRQREEGQGGARPAKRRKGVQDAQDPAQADQGAEAHSA